MVGHHIAYVTPGPTPLRLLPFSVFVSTWDPNAAFFAKPAPLCPFCSAVGSFSSGNCARATAGVPCAFFASSSLRAASHCASNEDVTVTGVRGSCRRVGEDEFDEGAMTSGRGVSGWWASRSLLVSFTLGCGTVQLTASCPDSSPIIATPAVPERHHTMCLRRLPLDRQRRHRARSPPQRPPAHQVAERIRI